MNHLGGANLHGDRETWMPDIWGWMLLEYDIRSVIDIGCGYGHNAQWFRSMGLQVLGVEGDPDAIAKNQLPRLLLLEHDYTTGPLRVGRFDMALMTEFVEHVEARYEDNWLATLDTCTWVLMCHAVPGQPGYHHVNCQDSEYWIGRLEKQGFTWYAQTSYRFRDTATRLPSSWGRPTLLLFRSNT